MQRNIELQNSILLFLMNKPNNNFQAISYEDYSNEDVSYQIQLLETEGLINAKKLKRTDSDPFNLWMISSCTSKGHSYLEGITEKN